jgi:hypothetical protein
MVPGYSNGLQQGYLMPGSGTADDGRCLICRSRFTHRHYLCTSDGKSSGPYCAAHFPLPTIQQKE